MSAAVAVSGGGGSAQGGGWCLLGGVCLGGCLPREGVYLSMQ